MKKSAPFLAALLLALGTSVGLQAQGQDDVHRPPAGDPVLPGVYRLQGHDPAIPTTDDLEPLRRKVGSAHVVGLGEAIHTSGGFHSLRDRAIRFLVEEMGFRAVAFEDNPAAAEVVDHYVQTCEGAPEQAVRSLYGVWESAEIASMVRWMCEWNQAHPHDRVHFFGFDIQQPEVDGPALIDFLRRAGLADDDPRIAGLRQCEGVGTRYYPNPIPEPVYRECVSALDAVEVLLGDNPGSLVRHTSLAELEEARDRRASLRAYEDEIRLFTDPAGLEARDRAMAERFAYLKRTRHPGLRTVIYAHNLHVARGGTQEIYGFRTMGSFLAESLRPADYVSIGLLANEMSIDWPGVGCGPAPLYNGPFSVEYELHNLGQGDLFVDLSFPGGAPPLLTPGSYYILSNQYVVPAQAHDALFYLEASPAMTPLFRPACR